MGGVKRVHAHLLRGFFCSGIFGRCLPEPFGNMVTRPVCQGSNCREGQPPKKGNHSSKGIKSGPHSRKVPCEQERGRHTVGLTGIRVLHWFCYTALDGFTLLKTVLHLGLRTRAPKPAELSPVFAFGWQRGSCGFSLSALEASFTHILSQDQRALMIIR